MRVESKQSRAKPKPGRKARPGLPATAAREPTLQDQAALPERLAGLPGHPTNLRLRQGQALQMQGVYGNRVTRRLLRRPRDTTLQREQTGGGTSPAAARSTEVPALTQTAYTTANSNLSRNPQAAINAVTADLASQGQMNLSYLSGNQMNYAPRAQLASGHYGHTSLTAGSGRPRPCRVIIGQDALRNVGILYTTIMHEWQHVVQFRSGPATGRGEAVDETEARLWEVENLEQSGLWRDIQYMSVLPGQLNHWWSRLGPTEQQLLATRYRQALQTIRRLNQRRLDEQFQQQTGR